MVWEQQYNPLGNAALSTMVAALPVILLLAGIAWFQIQIHIAASLGLLAAAAVALFAYHMPVSAVGGTVLYGALYGLFPIGWIILNLMFLYGLTVERGLFDNLRASLASLTPDPRVQVILIAFSFGAFIEGLAGFGVPVAITAALLIQLGLKPKQASVLALIANTAPVAFGSLGIPITTLSQMTGMDVLALSKMVGRQLPLFSVAIPFWVVCAFAGWRGALGVWPVALTAGVSFAVPQFLVSNYHGPWLVDMISGGCSIAATVLLLRFWRPASEWPLEPTSQRATLLPTPTPTPTQAKPSSQRQSPHGGMLQAWMPWMLLTLALFAWGLPQTRAILDGTSPATKSVKAIVAPEIPMPGVHLSVRRMPPVAQPGSAPERVLYRLNWLGATGTGILFTALLTGLLLQVPVRRLASLYLETLWKVRYSLVTIAAMLALGNVTKYSGTDATLGLALAGTGTLYPFFGTLLGWLGVALTGSDTASNVLFGGLQKITSEQLGISPILMGAANSSGGVMGKMIDAQSIVVASTATGYHGHEGAILRTVFWHSVALATLMGMLVYLQATVSPFTRMVVPPPPIAPTVVR